MKTTMNPKRFLSCLAGSILIYCVFLNSIAVAGDDAKLRIIVFGAHPDDCEIKAGGSAALWVAMGHKVKFVSTTNGDIGHATESGGALAKRRTAEVERAAEILGIETQVLDIHDGELMPTLENRRTICRLIREWKADLVISHRPNDYHPDHRYTGILLQDAAFMVTVPSFCPDTPHLARNPVFMFSSDRFQKPNPFDADVVVAIDEVFDKKVEALWQLESQIESLWAVRSFEEVVPVPASGPERAARKKKVYDSFAARARADADANRALLVELYGKRGDKVQFAEAFELCEYGSQPAREDLLKLFPFVGK